MRPARTLVPAALAALLVAGSGTTAGAQISLDLVMSDGVELATDLYAPNPEPQPVLLVRTPFGREAWQGFAGTLATYFDAKVVVQDTRGRGASGGDESLFLADVQDGHETVQWIEELGWSNGVVGGFGPGEAGIPQMLLAPGAPEAFRCLYVVGGTRAVAEELAYQGGVRRIELDAWLAAQGAEGVAADWAAHPDPGDPYWAPIRLEEGDAAAVHTAGLYRTGWYDVYLQGTLDWFSLVQAKGGDGAKGRQHLVVGPTSQAGDAGEIGFPAAEITDPSSVLDAAWSAQCLHGAAGALDALPAVHVFLMGANEDGAPGHVWQTFDAWPPPSAPVALFLRPGATGNALLLEPAEAAEGDLTFGHAPADPVPATGGRHMTLPSGPFDQQALEARPDVLVYTSEPLSKPVEVVGRVFARIWVLGGATETHVAVRLTDVYPDGRSMLVADGIRRFKASGKPQELEIDFWSTAMVFAAGHRIRVSVAGSMAGAFEVAPEAYTTNVLHSEAHPSRVVLPVRAGLENPFPPTEPPFEPAPEPVPEPEDVVEPSPVAEGGTDGGAEPADGGEGDGGSEDTPPVAGDEGEPDAGTAPDAAPDSAAEPGDAGDGGGDLGPPKGSGASDGGCAACGGCSSAGSDAAPWVFGLAWMLLVLGRRRTCRVSPHARS